MIDVPLVANNLEKSDVQAEAQYREAPWDAKRLVLKLLITKQVYENKKKGIDSSVIVYDETDKKPIYSYNTDYVHWAASLSKLFVTNLLLEDLKAGKTNLDTVVSWDASDRRAGAGVYDADNSPTSAPLRDVLFDMLNKSGNTAVRVIVNKALGGAAAVNARYEKMPELKVTRLEPIDASRFLLGYTTPGEVDFILKKLFKQTGPDIAFVKNALATNIFNDYGPRSQVKDPSIISVIDKQGQLNDPEGNNRHDVGYIENSKNGHKLRYVLMTTNYEQPAGEVTNYATSSLQQFGKDMLRYEGDKTPKTSDDAMELKLQQSSKVENGRLVY
jgi:beta-lactamase class A